MDWLANKLISGAALIGCAVLGFLLVVQTAALTRANAKVAAVELALQVEKTGRETDRKIVAEQYNTAMDDLRAKQSIVTTKYQEALNEARKQADLHRRDAAAARAQSDGLREQAVSAARLLADARTPESSVRRYAELTNGLLVECSQKYQELAGKTDRLSVDLRMTLDAWPSYGGR